LTGEGIFFKLGFMGKKAAGKSSPVGRKSLEPESDFVSTGKVEIE